MKFNNRNRYFCPVLGCPHANLAQAKGWGSLAGVKGHLKEHQAGRFSGAVPQAFLDAHNLCSCGVCGKIISLRSNGFCPTCHPARRAAMSNSPTEAPNTANLPSLDEICTTRIRLLKYVPRGVRPAWGQALAQAAAKVVWLNSTQAWTEWFMLPKCVLMAPPRRGRSHKNESTVFIRQRCERWLAGERRELWADGPGADQKGQKPKAPSPNSQACLERRHQRCLELAADGQYSKATSALVSPGLVKRNEHTEKVMRDKHPLAQNPPCLVDLVAPARSQVPDFDRPLIKKMVKSFARGTAPGPSGLRAQHLKDAIRSTHGDEATEQLAAICNLLAKGEAPALLAHHLAGASLMGMEKPGGGIRPIAVGEVLRRLVAKCFCNTFEKEVSSYLWPRQIGVAAPLGAEVGSQTVRQWCERNQATAGKILFVADFENAFNTIDREQFLRQVRHRLPGLSRWAEWCYGGPSKLFFDGTVINSEVGVQQGDPLGPLFFSYALQPLLLELGEISGLDISFSFLDDLVLAGTQLAVARGISLLEGSARRLGLKLNMSKCELVSPSPQGLGINWDLFDILIPRNLDGCLKLLGTPIGSDEYCQKLTQQRADGVQECLDALGELPDPQVALALLRSCASFGKMVFAARSTPYDVHQEQLLGFDKAVRRCFEHFTGLHPDDSQWLQASLSTRLGGLGLRSLSRHSPAAYLSSRSSCFQFCKELDPQHVWEANEVSSAVSKAVQEVNQLAIQDDAVPALSLFPVPVSSALQQRTLSGLIDAGTLKQLTDPNLAPLSSRAHMSLFGLEGAGTWLHTIPSDALGTKVEPSLFIIMLQRRLRMPIFGEPFFCPVCDGVMDVLADHALTCTCGGDRTRRHNQLRDTCVRLTWAAGWRPEPEKEGLLQATSFPASQEGDGLRDTCVRLT